MSASRRNSMSPAGELKREMKVRVISCLNRLSDRDTLTAATNELEAIARGLSQDSFATFLLCIHTTDSGEKSLVRRQCVRVLGLLAEAHGDDLAPHLVKMLATVIRRLKDNDSSVRSACVEAVVLMASRIRKPRFAVFFKSFMDVISVEQDYNSQIGSALCLAAAIEVSRDPEPENLAKDVPKLLKLAKSDCFKAKPALISLLGTILGAGGCSNKGVLDSVVSRAVELLSSEDWAARKAAVEVLEKLVVTDREMAVGYKKICLATLESRRFDKVKVVRDAMNQTLKLWKEVGIDGVELSPSTETQSQSSSRDTVRAGYSPLKSPTISSSLDERNKSPQSEKSVLPRSPPSGKSLRGRTEKPSPLKKSVGKSSVTFQSKSKGNSLWKLEVVVPRSKSLKAVQNDRLDEGNSDLVKLVGSIEKLESRLESKCMPLNGSHQMDEMKKHGGSKVGSRVFAVQEDANSQQTFAENISSVGECENNEVEGLSIVQQKLLHIENQQSNLLELLQRFMGSSQNGISVLESRVHGLEIALDEISHDLATSSGRMSSSESCCKLPGTEFLSPKFWRRSESKIINSRMNSPDSMRSPPSSHTFNNGRRKTQKLYLDQRFQPEDLQGNDFSHRDQNFIQGAQRVQIHIPKPTKFSGSSSGGCRSPLYT